MITGDIKNQVDRIWDVFWTSGITNPMYWRDVKKWWDK